MSSGPTSVLNSILSGIVIAYLIILTLNCIHPEPPGLTDAVGYSQAQLDEGPATSDSSDADSGLAFHAHAGHLPSVPNVEVSRETLLLLTVLFERPQHFVRFQPSVPVPLTKFFRTLFKTLISPNAP